MIEMIEKFSNDPVQLIYFLLVPVLLLIFLLSEEEFLDNMAAMMKIIAKKKDIVGTELEKPPMTSMLIIITLRYYAKKSQILLIKITWIISLLTLIVYVIIYVKAIDRQGVFHWMVNQLYRLFQKVENILCWAEEKENVLKHGWLIFLAIFTVMAIGTYYNAHRAVISLLGFMGLLLLWWLLLMERRNSCRALLKIELWGGLLFAAAVVADAEQYFEPSNMLVEYIIFVGVYTVFVVFTTLFANDVAAKLAFSIINTTTTLITILFNIGFLCMNLLSEMEAYDFLSSKLSGNEFALIVNLLLLPSLSAGYVALLFKEMQIYWRNHRRNENC